MSRSGRRSLRRSALAIVVTVCTAMAAAGCGGGSDATAGRGDSESRAAPQSATATGSAGGCFRAAGHQQVAGGLVDIPRRLSRRPPLLVAFHGLGDHPSRLARQSGFDGLAARHRFIVAYPDALHGRRWQLNHSDGDADIDHIRLFIHALVKRVCADPERVYLTGFSNGGGFAYRAGCELRDMVAAIAPVAGSYRSQDPCSAGAMPTLEIHGRDPWTSTVARLIADMKRRNHCSRPPVTRRLARGVTRTRWPGCNLERVYNRTIGHEWPRLGPYDTSAEVWRFVSRYRR